MGGVKKWLCKICGAACRHKQAVGMVAGVLAFLLVMGLIPAVLWPNEAKTLVLEWLQFAAYLVGAVFVVQQLRISNRRATALEKTAALGEKGNITERFKNAIEHLGGESESIRMGGIYGLYHVAQESRGYADTVLKILCAHAKSIMAKPRYTEKEKPSNEIAAILDVLFPIISDSENQENEILFGKVDISDWYLQGVNVSNRNMKYVHGVRVHLLFAQLLNADLSEANLWDTNLSGTNLSGANLSGANLGKVNLEKANLESTNLSAANLSAANLSEASLGDVNLSKADLSWANLSGANLSRANLRKAHLWDTNLSNASMSKADLSGANLSGAGLWEANLSGADLSGADLSGADLEKANLSEAHITAEQLLQAKTLYEVTLDDHIHEEMLRREQELLDYPDGEE